MKYTTFNATSNTNSPDINTKITFIAIGRVVCINGTSNNGMQTGTPISIGWIPDCLNPYGTYERFKPINDTWLSCDYYKGASFDGMPEAYIKPNGIFYAAIHTANHDMKISGVYICKG